MSNFTPTAKRVVRTMFRLGRWATINEIAKYSDNMSWNTAKKVIDELYKKGVVQKTYRNNKEYWLIKEI